MSQVLSCPRCGGAVFAAGSPAGQTLNCSACGAPVLRPSEPPVDIVDAQQIEQWFVNFPDGRRIGPATREQLVNAFRGGQIVPQCSVQRSDWPQARSASEVATMLGMVAPGSQLVPNVAPPTPMEPAKRRKYLVILGGIGAAYVAVIVLAVTIGLAMGGVQSAVAGLIGSVFPAALFMLVGLLSLGMSLFRSPLLFQSPLRKFGFAGRRSDEDYQFYLMLRSFIPIALGFGFAFFGIFLAVSNGLTERQAAQQRAAGPVARQKSWKEVIRWFDSPKEALAHRNDAINHVRNTTNLKGGDEQAARGLAEIAVLEEERSFFQMLLDQYPDNPCPADVLETELLRCKQALELAREHLARVADQGPFDPEKAGVEIEIREREDSVETIEEMLKNME